MNNTKPYKAAKPEATVERISGIISRYNIPTKEIPLGDGDMFCSCRITITRDDDFSIGTNGKGRNQIYARASGYAEFMERLQNRVIVYPNPASIQSEYRFYPDEKPYEWGHEEAVENIKRFVPRVYPAEGLEADYVSGLYLPFYHVNAGKVEDVPYSLVRWINGSNGMCAGNIPEEALIQGFNEIFERYCIQEMYKRNIVPPDVPMSEFAGTSILERLERMKREYGMDFRIKDYSLGEGFPVVGLMVYSPDKSKYIMHFGSDLDASVALERAFTEIFQGYTAKTLAFENDVNKCERLDLFNEFKRSLMYGRGRLPQSFFTSEPSYEHKGHTSIPVGKDFREDLNNICQWIMAKGYEIYIRDNSFLGFPALHVVIPGMSEIDHAFCNLNRRISHMQLTENRVNPLFRLASLDAKETRETIHYLEQLDMDALELFTRNSNPKNHVNRHLLLMLLHLKAGDDDGAKKSLENYQACCQKKGRQMPEVYRHLMDRLSGKESDPANETPAMKLASEILAAHDGVLGYIATPKCFDCEHCPLAQGCRFPLLESLEKIMQEAMKANVIRQEPIGSLFNERNEHIRP